MHHYLYILAALWSNINMLHTLASNELSLNFAATSISSALTRLNGVLGVLWNLITNLLNQQQWEIILSDYPDCYQDNKLSTH